jgi:hypothetical protein
MILKGRVVNKAGEPVPALSVSWYSMSKRDVRNRLTWEGRVDTDASGNFEIQVQGVNLAKKSIVLSYNNPFTHTLDSFSEEGKPAGMTPYSKDQSDLLLRTLF